MKEQNGQVKYAEEYPTTQVNVEASSQEQLAPLLKTTKSSSGEQVTPMEAGTFVQVGPRSSRWRSLWLATTLALIAIPLLIGGICLFLFTGVYQELMIALLLVGVVSLCMVVAVYFGLSRILGERSSFLVGPPAHK